MRNSIFVKIFSGFLLITIVLCVFFLFYTYGKINSFFNDELKQELSRVGAALSITIETYLDEQRNSELDSFIKTQGTKLDARITVVTADGAVIADSENDPETMENHAARPEIRSALEGFEGYTVRYSETVNMDMMYVAVPLVSDGEVRAVIRTSLYMGDIIDLRNNLKTEILWVALIFAFVVIALSALISSGISRPVKLIVNAFRRVGAGDFNVRLHLKSRDEMQELASSFNSMAGQIDTLFSELSAQKAELDSVISAMREGLVVLDGEGRIILSNERFREIVEQDAVSGQNYWEIIRSPGLDELISKVRESGKYITEELALRESTFLCSASFISIKDEVLITFYDVSDIKKFERMKKDLVVNVSHELRTPLTALKGYIETLAAEEKDKDRQHYIEIISRHTDRLINIVKDLLALSELEKSSAVPVFEKVNINDVIGRVTSLFDQIIREKGLALNAQVDDDVPEINADSFKLEQMFINLIENAINYTEKGSINVNISRDNSGLLIKVQDSGLGIEKQHLPRIFERFYVTNKSRSRNFSGTGLGLAIVKHIVLLHRGTIDVESTPGTGTTFVIHLPA